MPTDLPAARLRPDARCPCLSGEVYGACCGPLHAGAAEAPTAERLMRSRYSAFAVGDATYLLATWATSTRPTDLEVDSGVRWFRLDIVETRRGSMLDTEGTVTFEARYRDAEGAHVLRERSRFAREGGRWVYVDGS